MRRKLVGQFRGMYFMRRLRNKPRRLYFAV